MDRSLLISAKSWSTKSGKVHKLSQMSDADFFRMLAELQQEAEAEATCSDWTKPAVEIKSWTKLDYVQPVLEELRRRIS